MPRSDEPEFAQDDDDRDAGRGDSGDWLAAAAEQIAAETRAHPARTLGVAFGVGYVLGGGIPRFAVRLGTMALLRKAGEMLLESGVLATVAHRFLHARDSADLSEPVQNNGHRRRRHAAPKRSAGGRFES
jgi:hypothetical protein